jgi:hypothetical protein
MPRCYPNQSMVTPVIGTPAAFPRVVAEPCQPIASPRLPAGTTRESSSLTAVTVGEDSEPATVRKTMGQVRSGAAATRYGRDREQDEHDRGRRMSVQGAVHESGRDGGGRPRGQHPPERPRRRPVPHRRDRHEVLADQDERRRRGHRQHDGHARGEPALTKRRHPAFGWPGSPGSGVAAGEWSGAGSGGLASQIRPPPAVEASWHLDQVVSQARA